MDAVLEHLDEAWPLQRMAGAAGYSPHHFHRLFARVMGETPQRFVARARAERAAALLASAPDMLVTEASAEVGFASPSQLSRAFRRRFGLAPAAWNRSAPLHQREAHAVLARFPLTAPSAEAAGDTPVEVRPLPGFHFAYLRIPDPYGSDALAQAWHALSDACTRQGRGRTFVGMSWDDPDVVPAELCRYDLGVVVTPHEASPAGTSRRWIPSTLIAELHCSGDIDAVDRTWQTLARAWLPHSAFRRALLPAMEWFHDDPSRTHWTRWDLHCLVPVC